MGGTNLRRNDVFIKILRCWRGELSCQVCEVIFVLLLGYSYNRGWCLNIGAVSFSLAKNFPVIDNLFEMLGLSPAPSKELCKKKGSVDVVETALHRKEEILITY